MLKVVTESKKGRLLILGFSRQNLEKLGQGMPVDIDLTVFKDNPIAHIVFYGGETEESMAAEMKKAGLWPREAVN